MPRSGSAPPPPYPSQGQGPPYPPQAPYPQQPAPSYHQHGPMVVEAVPIYPVSSQPFPPPPPGSSTIPPSRAIPPRPGQEYSPPQQAPRRHSHSGTDEAHGAGGRRSGSQGPSPSGRPRPTTEQREVCVCYLTGYCADGANCPYLHDEMEYALARSLRERGPPSPAAGKGLPSPPLPPVAHQQRSPPPPPAQQSRQREEEEREEEESLQKALEESKRTEEQRKREEENFREAIELSQALAELHQQRSRNGRVGGAGVQQTAGPGPSSHAGPPIADAPNRQEERARGSAPNATAGKRSSVQGLDPRTVFPSFLYSSIAGVRTQFMSRHSREVDERCSCSICMCEFEAEESVMLLPCFHQFHTDCVTDWLKRQPHCPICDVEVYELLKESEEQLQSLEEKERNLLLPATAERGARPPIRTGPGTGTRAAADDAASPTLSETSTTASSPSSESPLAASFEGGRRRHKRGNIFKRFAARFVRSPKGAGTGGGGGVSGGGGTGGPAADASASERSSLLYD